MCSVFNTREYQYLIYWERILLVLEPGLTYDQIEVGYIASATPLVYLKTSFAQNNIPSSSLFSNRQSNYFKRATGLNTKSFTLKWTHWLSCCSKIVKNVSNLVKMKLSCN